LKLCCTVSEIFSVKERRNLETGVGGRSIDHIRLSIGPLFKLFDIE